MGRQLYRDMPWRNNTDPYWVLVSELMLQQTQVDRVIPKFELFMRIFPDITALAKAPLSEVLTIWSGLGYNRRAKFLHETAQKVVKEFKGQLPSTYSELVSLPGIGPGTAGAILAYSFNEPVTFIETNVRTVYFHHFFNDQLTVADSELKEIVASTVDMAHPRQWYWALMDYGSYLKKHGAGRNSKSKHYKKQTPLQGSLREVRGLIVKTLAIHDQTYAQLESIMPHDSRYTVAIEALLREGMVTSTAGRLHLAQ